VLLYIQWARGATPQDWQTYEIGAVTDWRKLPKRDEPFSGMSGTVDIVHPDYGTVTVPDATAPDADDEGWIYDMSIAGISMSGADHIAIRRDGPRIALTRWNDDAEWVALGDRYAQEWSFGMPVEDPAAVASLIARGQMTQPEYDAMSLEERVQIGAWQMDQQLTVWAESSTRRAAYEGIPAQSGTDGTATRQPDTQIRGTLGPVLVQGARNIFSTPTADFTGLAGQVIIVSGIATFSIVSVTDAQTIVVDGELPSGEGDLAWSITAVVQYTGGDPVRHPIVVADWASFTEPGPANIVRHGIWLTDAQVAAHEAAKTYEPSNFQWAGATGT
jgi:hypothetical protein